MNLVMDEIRLLILEEHAAVRDALQVRLEASPNLEIVAACQNKDFWQLEHPNDKVDVVLLGINSGRQRPLTPIIRDVKAFNLSGTAVVVLASLADDLEKEMILQAGAQRYLLKDINSQQLIAEIEAIGESKKIIKH
jgi:DNA-binding NarL/FixJ family response regulator